jgi:quinolinate synthase
MAATAIDLQPYASLSDQDCDARITRAKQALGDRVVILGHHYQRDEVFKHADFSGDSLKLSRQAAASKAEYIVFCGVHFMAEVADIISRPEQVSILPDLSAGCAMADMADLEQVERAWQELNSVLDADEYITPVTYINSAANLKSFCGKHGGIVCTSTNAQKILEWSFERREKVLFFPDQHLGRNTGYKMGIPLEDMVVWDYDMPMGDSMERILFGTPDVQARTDRKFSAGISRGQGNFASGGKFRGLPDVGLRRLHRIHHQDDYRGRTGHAVAGRHRAEPG